MEEKQTTVWATPVEAWEAWRGEQRQAQREQFEAWKATETERLRQEDRRLALYENEVRDVMEYRRRHSEIAQAEVKALERIAAALEGTKR